MAYLIGVAGVLIIWLFYRLFSGKWDLMSLAEGDDGLPSSSQFQFMLWTLVVIFSYITIYAARAQMGEYGAITEIPVNLLILMGISSFALLGSRSITSYQLSSGTASIKKDRRPVKGSSFKHIICDDEGKPALNKLQMIAWTYIAIAIYIILVVKQVGSGELPVLPDVDGSLLVLMGISQGTYLGKRLMTTTTPAIKELTPRNVKPGDEVTIKGMNLGDEQSGNQIKVGDYYPSQITSWKNDEVIFELPQGVKRETQHVSVVIGGKESNKLDIEINGNKSDSK